MLLYFHEWLKEINYYVVLSLLLYYLSSVASLLSVLLCLGVCFMLLCVCLFCVLFIVLAFMYYLFENTKSNQKEAGNLPFRSYLNALLFVLSIFYIRTLSVRVYFIVSKFVPFDWTLDRANLWQPGNSNNNSSSNKNNNISLHCVDVHS